MDLETLHVDVCPSLAIFGGPAEAGRVEARFPGACRAAQVVQLPVYESLTDAEVDRVATVLRSAVTETTTGALAASRA